MKLANCARLAQHAPQQVLAQHQRKLTARSEIMPTAGAHGHRSETGLSMQDVE